MGLAHYRLPFMNLMENSRHTICPPYGVGNSTPREDEVPTVNKIHVMYNASHKMYISVPFLSIAFLAKTLAANQEDAFLHNKRISI